MSDLLLAEDVGAVRVLTLSDPLKRNALSAPMRIALRDALSEAHTDDDVRTIIVGGAGGFFCSGGDISAMLDEEQPTVHRLQVLADVIELIVRGGKPVVAAVEGGSYGAGLSLAAACDHVVAARDARFCASFGGVGLASDGGLGWTLPRRVGRGRATEMILFGEPVRAERACEIGLVERVVEPGEAGAEAMRRAEALAARSRPALAATKALLAEELSLTEVLVAETRTQRELFQGPDLAEGVVAFREKRPPTFQA